MKLSERINALPEGIQFHSQKFDIAGKQIVKYTLDFTVTDKVDKRKRPVTVANDNAHWYKGNEVAQLTVNNIVIDHLKLDKEKVASRKWLKTDLTADELAELPIIRGKMAFLRSTLAVEALKDKVQKALANQGVTLIADDAETFNTHLDATINDIKTMLKVGAPDEPEIEELY